MATKEKIWLAFDHNNILYRFSELSDKILDYLALRKIVLGGRTSEQLFVYTGVSPSKNVYKRRKSRNDFYTFLIKNGFSVITIPVKILPNGHYQEKGVDVRLALDCLEGAYEDQYNHLILISGDGDFAPLIEKVKKYHKTVEIWAFRSGISPRLSQLLGYRFVNFLDDKVNELELVR
jgi:uncharacterized LabA/DUF88 family protein